MYSSNNYLHHFTLMVRKTSKGYISIKITIEDFSNPIYLSHERDTVTSMTATMIGQTKEVMNIRNSQQVNFINLMKNFYACSMAFLFSSETFLNYFLVRAHLQHNCLLDSGESCQLSTLSTKTSEMIHSSMYTYGFRLLKPNLLYG